MLPKIKLSSFHGSEWTIFDFLCIQSTDAADSNPEIISAQKFIFYLIEITIKMCTILIWRDIIYGCL